MPKAVSYTGIHDLVRKPDTNSEPLLICFCKIVTLPVIYEKTPRSD